MKNQLILHAHCDMKFVLSPKSINETMWSNGKIGWKAMLQKMGKNYLVCKISSPKQSFTLKNTH